jgi:hypothetical protein
MFHLLRSIHPVRSTILAEISLAGVLGLLLAAALPAAATLPPCPADLNGDAEVDALDLNLLLAVWGTPEPGADFDHDGDVGCFDLAYLQGNWGSCPTNLLDVDRDGAVTPADGLFMTASVGLDCQVDLDENGVIEANDVDALLCLWGTASPLGDFDDDGRVGSLDLNYLLASFGAGCTCDLDGDLAVTATDLEIFHKGIGK